MATLAVGPVLEQFGWAKLNVVIFPYNAQRRWGTISTKWRIAVLMNASRCLQ